MSIKLDDFDGLLDWERLQAWIAANDLPGSGPVTAVEQLTGGSQNNIFRLTRTGAQMVLRRPPKHLRANSNSTMLREARVLGALNGSGVPAPALYGECADESVIGACFYVMEPINGFTPTGELPGNYANDPRWRWAMAEALIDGAAKLAQIDPNAVGLSDFGKPDRWVERQVERWRSQLASYSELSGYDGPDLPGFERVAGWLDANQPPSCRIGIIHGDFQWANVMFAHDRPELVALVDWELCTLGDPLLDLGWILTSWDEPGDPEGHQLQVSPWDGFPTRDQLIERYAAASGHDVTHVPWYFVLACYKLGVILEGSWARALSGQASMDMGQRLHETADWLFRKANQLIDHAEAS
ncbi:MAG: phosphotransferase family protein [Acidimicrobiia bacterium]